MTHCRFVITLLIIGQISVLVTANGDEPLGRNYRKSSNNYPANGKIGLSTSETKISSVSYKPNESNNLKTAASEEDKFSIGLGVLSPSYSQVFGEDGKTKLDFNSEKGGFSYSLTNVVHPHQPGASSSASLAQGSAALQSSLPSSSSATSSSSPSSIASNTLNKVQSAGFIPSAYYNNPSPAAQPSPQVNIYHKQSGSADANQAIYGRLSSSNYPLPPSGSSPYATPQSSPYSPQIAAPQNPISNNYPAQSPYGAYPAPSSNYNPYNAAIAPQPFNPALSDAEKSFLQTVPQGPSSHIAAHQHQLPQPLPSPSQVAPQHQHQPQQPITQPKLVAQQQLTANPNPGNIVHNANYGPFSNPYASGAQAPNPYANLPGGYPGLLNMAASQQLPIGTMGSPDQLGQMNGGGLGAMNFDYLSGLNDPFMY